MVPAARSVLYATQTSSRSSSEPHLLSGEGRTGLAGGGPCETALRVPQSDSSEPLPDCCECQPGMGPQKRYFPSPKATNSQRPGAHEGCALARTVQMRKEGWREGKPQRFRHTQGGLRPLQLPTRAAQLPSPHRQLTPDKAWQTSPSQAWVTILL